MSGAPPLPQRLLTGMLRAALKLLLRPVLHPRFPLALQRRWLRLLARLTLGAAGARVLPGAWDGVRAERVLPAGEPTLSLLYLHGGAYVSGGSRTHRAITTQLAVRARAEVLALDYRLAPEHPFPAALEDAVAAYRALRAREPGRPIALAGDSAGGGLALATALRLRELGEPLPHAIALFSPWADLGLAGLPQQAPPGEAMLSHDWLRASAAAYLGGRPAQLPLASPLHADLRGLPPLLVQVGTDELLLADAQRLADRARAAGVDVRLRIHPALWHVFQLHAGVLRAADAALEEAAGFLRAGVLQGGAGEGCASHRSPAGGAQARG